VNFQILFVTAIVLAGYTGKPAFAQNAGDAPPITQVMVTLTLKPEARQQPEVMSQMSDEVRATLRMYLGGMINQWYWRGDGRGVLLILNAKSIAEAEDMVNELPFRRADATTAEYVPLSPMIPLGALLSTPADAQ
jgi:hypothetical protein